MLRARTARSKHGSMWTIRRRWARKPRWRGPIGRGIGKKASRILEHADFFDFDIEALFWGLLFLVAAAALVVFMIFVGIPLLIFLIDTLLIIPILLVAGGVGRVLFRRPWTIEAVRTDPPGGPAVAWSVVGWRASSRAAARMTTFIYAAGEPPPAPPADIVGPHPRRRLPR